MAQIIPGILTNDEKDYVRRLRIAEAVAPLIQVDVLDGKFAPNTTIGPETIKRHPSSSMLEVQLIVKKPKVYIDQLIDLDFVSRIIFPYESDEDVKENIHLIRANKKQAGLSINPETAVLSVFPLMSDIDLLCIFAASPGFSGKRLESSVYGRIKETKQIKPGLPVEIDIGVNLETAPKLARVGADFLIATSALRNAPDFSLAYAQLAKAANVC
ncbi:MAG: Ribulose-phosphate 3-epimerase [Candidatus Curtissbacteria bacterium GW2011_GWA1_40_9]|uniref:Ribulose-phosphate 3-epimerase n=1 Tax=Candidatus Curtissbacteria bacterium GW2011_GWA1_40_9 TaxID=1618408 RepID=A0A0G0TMC7_9BACT|nr:MAG: Ribulose-phosphate 3-epimerase [Candidatus Curtissbacteria bacterium GW2011_GWA1_40_9]